MDWSVKRALSSERERDDQFFGRLVAPVPILRQASSYDSGNRGRNACWQFRWGLVQDRTHGRDFGAFPKGAPTGQHLIEDGTEAEYIGALICRFPPNLFR